MIEFRVLNKVSKKVLRDSSQYHADISRNDGVGVLIFNSDDLIELQSTGEKTVDGVKVFDGDIIEAVITTNRGEEVITDHVHWENAGWRFGNFDGTLADVVIRAVKGNIFETPWPIERPVG